MSRGTGTSTPVRSLIAAAALGAILAVGGAVTAALLLRSPAQSPDSPCRIAANEAYAARVDTIMAEYHRAVARDGEDPRVGGAAASAFDVAEYGFVPLFQMQACSVEESDLSGVTELGGLQWDLRQVIYDPEFAGDWRSAPIDIEVAWYAELGIEGLVAGWSTIARLDHEDVGVVQRLLSLGLAHATNPDRDAVLAAGVYPDFVIDKDRYLGYAYTAALADLGDQRIELARYTPLRWSGDAIGGDYLLDDPDEWEVVDTGPTVYGWTVLAPLLRFGDFHAEFLTPVATAIIEFDQRRNGDWTIEGEERVSFDAFDDDPTSAMPAVLEALSRNPAAAEAVFEATGDQRVGALLNRG